MDVGYSAKIYDIFMEMEASLTLGKFQGLLDFTISQVEHKTRLAVCGDERCMHTIVIGIITTAFAVEDNSGIVSTSVTN